MNAPDEREQCPVQIYMVQIDETLYRTLKSRGGGYDSGINDYLRQRLNIPEPVYPIGESDLLDDDLDEISDEELLRAIPLPSGPRIPQYSVPIAADLYEVLVNEAETSEKKIILLLEEMAAEMNQSQSRSR